MRRSRMSEAGNREIGNNSEIIEVIAACLRNDPRGQRMLIQRFYGYVKSICLRYSSDNDDAEEILNDSFMKVFQHLKTYREDQPFKAWLRSITVNTAIDHYRKRLRVPDRESVDDLQIVDIQEDIISKMSAEEILSMVRKLSPMYRMVFSMFVMDGYTHREIAEQLGISEGTSKSNLNDARKKLQSMILKLNPTLYAAYELKNSTRNEE